MSAVEQRVFDWMSDHPGAFVLLTMFLLGGWWWITGWIAKAFERDVSDRLGPPYLTDEEQRKVHEIVQQARSFDRNLRPVPRKEK